MADLPISLISTEVRGKSVSFHFKTASPLKRAFLGDHIKITPEIDFEYSYQPYTGDTIKVFSRNFKCGQKYRAVFTKGITNLDGAVLDKDLAAEFIIKDLPPDLHFVTSGVYLPRNSKKMVIPFSATNVKKIRITVDKAYENNLNPYRDWTSAAHDRMVRIAEKTMDLPDVKDTETFHEIDLTDVLGGRKSGIYKVAIEKDGPEYGVNACCDVSVTDLAVQAVEDSADRTAVVFVRSLETGKPVPDAALTVFSRKNCVIATGKTDAVGSAMLKYDPAWNDRQDYASAVLVKTAGDITYFRLTGSHYYSHRAACFNPSYPNAFVFFERGIARPGEKITASVFLRQAKNNTWVPLKNIPVTLRLSDPEGNGLIRKDLKVDEFGFVQQEFTIPESGRTGSYDLCCFAADACCGSAHIQVADFVPDRFKVTGSVKPTESNSADQPITFGFQAKYYFGATVDQGTCRFYPWTNPLTSMPHWDNSWSAGSRDAFKQAKNAEKKSVALNGKPFIYTYPGFVKLGGKTFNPVQIGCTASVSEPGGNTISCTKSKILFPADFFLGVREGKSSPSGKTIELTLLPAVKDQQINLKEPLEVKLSFTRHEWEYAFVKTGKTIRREWQKRSVHMPEKAVTLTIPAGVFKAGTVLTANAQIPSGQYTLNATSAGNFRSDMDFFHASGEGSFRSSNPNSLYLTLNAQTCKPGDTVKFSFDAPGDGEIFIVEGEKTIRKHSSAPVKSGKNELSLTIPADIHSSSYFAGCTVTAKNGTNWVRSFNLLTIPVDQSDAHRLTVGIKAPETARPQEKIPVTLTLSDAAGKPQSGLVVLYAVDSGVISLTDYQAPDIFRCFYGPVGCAFEFYDMYSMLYEDLVIGPDGKIGGGGGFAQKIGRIKQKHTARIIAPKVIVPASGTATVTVDLPDHTGALDIFAVASAENAAGSARSSISTRLPVTVNLSAPRFIAPGDTASITLNVFNNMPGEADYTCTVTLPDSLEPMPGASLVFEGKGLKKDASKTLTLNVKANDTVGSGLIKVEMKSGGTIAKDDSFVTVRSPNVSRSEYKVVSLKPGETFTADFSGDYIGKADGFVRVSGSPVFSLINALDWLNEYPYGCLEQTTATAFPLLFAPELQKCGLIDRAMTDAAMPKISAAVAQIAAMSRWNGSFSMWPNGQETWTEGTLFALHFLFEAEDRQLLKINASDRADHIRWLCSLANNADPKNRAARAYATYILALANDNGFLTPAKNLMAASEKPDFALMLTAAALIRGGYADIAVKPFNDALTAECWRENGVPVSFSTEASRLGMLLYILMDSGIRNDALAAILALKLATQIRTDGSAWGSTQANAWAAIGLAAYASKYPPGPASADITVQGRTVKTAIEKSKMIRPENGSAITVTNTSGGEIIVESRITGIPKAAPQAGGKLKVSKQYLDLSGKPVTEVKHGDLINVCISFESPVEIRNLVIADLLPAGLQIEDGLLATRAANLPESISSKYGNLWDVRLEQRDDRFLLFANASKGKSRIVYRVRAVSRGSFVIPPVHAESMYDPDLNGISGESARFTVK